ncbi:MAG: UDP-N-acetylglucosamine 2-epimerase [Phycisphaerae bacterium]|jgi:GDP/UDP-N,N'-diacetylbacillosamine 2-epimerase (hydrolysing)
MRKVCVITGSRAEYSLLRPLMKEIEKDTELRLQLIVTGMHLSLEFGSTYKAIEADGFAIDKKIKILSKVDTPVGISKSMGLAITGFAKAYERLKPVIIVVLGDRFEIFGAVAAALVSRIPVAHIHGGEITEGAFDDAMRHCITKMSHLHFASTKEYRKRVIQLGESPGRVFNVGALGVENIKRMEMLSMNVLERELRFKFKKHNLLVTFHPVTLENNTSEKHFQVLLNVLDRLEDTGIIFTKSNADPGGRLINKMIDKYISKNSSKAAAFTSLGGQRYLSLMRYADAVVGNSSSGIVEAPSLNVGTINIGDRQKGRVRAESVIDCQCKQRTILKAFERLYSREFQSLLKKVKNPYEGDGNAAKSIKDKIKNIDLSNLIKKKFHNII